MVGSLPLNEEHLHWINTKQRCTSIGNLSTLSTFCVFQVHFDTDWRLEQTISVRNYSKSDTEMVDVKPL